MQSNEEWATIGKIAAPFGLNGELKVFPLSDIPNRFARLDTIYLGSTHKPYTIKGVRPYKGEMLLLKLADVEDANTAATLRNQDICIPLSQLATLPSDSYYQHDIIGLSVETVSGRKVGIIKDIIVTGSNDVYIIQDEHGQQFFIPAIKEVITHIDLMRHMMYIDPIQGLLDDKAVIDTDELNTADEEDK